MSIENKQSYDKIFESDIMIILLLLKVRYKKPKVSFDQDSEKRDEISDMLKNGNLEIEINEDSKSNINNFLYGYLQKSLINNTFNLLEHNNEFSYVENKSQFNDLLQNNYHSNYIKPIQAQLFQKNIKFEIDYSKKNGTKMIYAIYYYYH